MEMKSGSAALTRVAIPETDQYLNRELSLLEFNLRVLAQAEDVTLPLLERLRFLCIVSSNIDEFFVVRVASLLAQHKIDTAHGDLSGLFATTLEKFIDIAADDAQETQALQQRQVDVFRLRQHAHIEFEQGQLAIEVLIGFRNDDRYRRGAA